MPTWNDEPCLSNDELGHNALVRVVYQRIRDCEAPYVLGIGGTWGSGKTSFLRRLYVALGGPFDAPPAPDDAGASPENYWRWQWFANKADATFHKDYELIWFNAWHHQMEANPLVALLHEIRQHFTLTESLWDRRGNIMNATRVAGLAMLDTLIKTKLGMELKTGEVVKAFKEADVEAFGPLTASERFRAFFEQAVKMLVGDKGRLIIFVDDLDRCEGDKAFALLEAMKLYLNANRCVFVLGMDREHLERNIAPCLKGGDRTTAREYLGKIFQNTFLLPTQGSAKGYLASLVSQVRTRNGKVSEDTQFLGLLKARFGFPKEGTWGDLVATLDTNLPHNPRKIKSFVLSWKTYVQVLAASEARKYDWELTLILHYLGQFEEPLLRQLEEDASFYEELVQFCERGSSREVAFQGIVPPYEFRKGAGGASDGPASMPRTLYIAPLIRRRALEPLGVVHDHLPFGSSKPVLPKEESTSGNV